MIINKKSFYFLGKSLNFDKMVIDKLFSHNKPLVRPTNTRMSGVFAMRVDFIVWETY